ncbi:MAG: hypothetical protein ACI8W8_002615 [Rhodothermales bacterium]|jgi:hypothetical protein
MSQGRQIVLAWTDLMDENDGVGFNYTTSDPKNRIWTDHFQDYLADPAVRTCPSTQAADPLSSSSYLMGRSDAAWRENRKATKAPWNSSSFAYNINLCPKNTYNRGNTYERLTAVINADETPVVGDAWWRAPAHFENHLPRNIPRDLHDPINGDPSRVRGPGNNTANRFITNRHGAVTVLTFVDGHTALTNFEDVFRQQWWPGYDPDQPVSY